MQRHHCFPHTKRLPAYHRLKVFMHPEGSIVLLPKRPASILRAIVKLRRLVTIEEMGEPAAAGAAANALPRSRFHHREVHRSKDERAWSQQAGIEPLKVARKLWKHTRVDEGHI